MNIIPWRRREPLSPFGFDLDDLWSRLAGNGEGGLATRLPEVFRGAPVPAVNVAESEDSFHITMDCPGLDEKDFQVEAMGDQIVISGERKWEEEKQGKEFRCVESQYGKFQRTVQLPANARIEAGEVDAHYKKGVLTITVPKLERTPSAKIHVRGE